MKPIYFVVAIIIVGLLYRLFQAVRSKKTIDEPISEKEEDACTSEDPDRKEFLENEARFNGQRHPVKRANTSDKLILGYLLDTVLDIDQADVSNLCIVDRNDTHEFETTTISEIDSIWNYDMFSSVIQCDDNGKWSFRPGQNTVLVIDYKTYSKEEKSNHSNAVNDAKQRASCYYDNSILLFLRALTCTDHTFYMRVSIMIPNFSAQEDDMKTQFSQNAPLTTSLILAFDAYPQEDKLKSFNDLMATMHAKLEKQEELTDDEVLVLRAMHYCSDLGYDLSEGISHMNNHRYTEALYYFLRVYEHLKLEVHKHDQYTQLIFFGACYRIGYCFNELGKYDKAYFYLDFARLSGNVKYKIEFINTLVNSLDVRALPLVLKEIESMETEGKELDSESSHYLHFLKRRLAYLYIEHKMYDKAKELLVAMKDDELDQAFAREELAYIESKEG